MWFIKNKQIYRFLSFLLLVFATLVLDPDSMTILPEAISSLSAEFSICFWASRKNMRSRICSLRSVASTSFFSFSSLISSCSCLCLVCQLNWFSCSACLSSFSSDSWEWDWLSLVLELWSFFSSVCFSRVRDASWFWMNKF